MRSAFGTGWSANFTRDLYMREHLWVNLSSRNMLYQLCNVNREKHKLKSHRVCRRDREPSRIPIRSLKSLRNKSRRVREFVYARILSCFPMSSTLYCYVNAKSIFKKKKFVFNCRSRFGQSIREVIKNCSYKFSLKRHNSFVLPMFVPKWIFNHRSETWNSEKCLPRRLLSAVWLCKQQLRA